MIIWCDYVGHVGAPVEVARADVAQPGMICGPCGELKRAADVASAAATDGTESTALSAFVTTLAAKLGGLTELQVKRALALVVRRVDRLS